MRLSATLILAAGVVAVLATATAATPSADLEEVLRAIPDPSHGARLFETCAQCHGPRGGGLPSGWVPEIAGQHAHFLAKELVDYRHHARWDDRMEKVAGRHLLATPQDIADVVAFVGSMAPSLQSMIGNGTWVDRGSRLYQARCRSCHGAGGEGSDARLVPRVAGQQSEYLLRQLHDTVDGRRPNMERVHVRLLSTLGMEELEGLADFMARLPPGPRGERTAATGAAPRM